MKKFLTLALIGAAVISSPVYAQTANDENVKSDVHALDKDNAALAKDHDALANDRAAKAQDKVNGDSTKQAEDSVKIGAVKTAIAEKKAEKGVDKKILRHHKKKMKKEDASPAPAPSN